jgi:hypothetical protein
MSRRGLLRHLAGAAAVFMVPQRSDAASDPDRERLTRWTDTLRSERLVGDGRPFGGAGIRVGELATGTPYVAGTLDAYLKYGGNPVAEPLTVSLTRFDCVTLVESCLAVARGGCGTGAGTWDRFGREIERMRYRGGRRLGYTSRLHYFSEWIRDGASRGLVKDLGAELGGTNDTRPLRFMTQHRGSYAALADESVFEEITLIERGLDGRPRFVVPTKRIPEVLDGLETGDVLAFATEIDGLDVTHSAFVHRGDDRVVRVLHAPLSGGVVEITRTTLPEYVAAIRRATGILVARPLRA